MSPLSLTDTLVITFKVGPGSPQRKGFPANDKSVTMLRRHPEESYR